MVSIVLPTYNGARYLRESIDSVLGQTYKDWELIIVDDCSTDATPQIAEEYAARDNRIHVIHNQRNEKLPRSLNIGFAVSRGEYLTWTSDDNRYLPMAIEKMKVYLDVHRKVYLVCASMYIIDCLGQRCVSEGFPKGKFIPGRKEIISYNDTIGACFMYRRSAMEQIGGYDETMFCVEDYEYWLRIYEQFENIEAIPEFLYEYRVHENSLTATKKDLVRSQLHKLRKKHLVFIVNKLKNNFGYLLRVYHEMCYYADFSQEEKNIFNKYAPWLKGMKDIPQDKEYIIYGAGEYGRHLCDKISSQVACFADRNTKLTGTVYNKKVIYQLQEARKKFPDAWIIVAGNLNIAGDMISTIWNAGIREYSYVWNR